MYFERALQKLKEAINNEPIDVRDINPQWIERENSNLPNYMEYADDCDFLTENEKNKRDHIQESQRNTK